MEPPCSDRGAAVFRAMARSSAPDGQWAWVNSGSAATGGSRHGHGRKHPPVVPAGPVYLSANRPLVFGLPRRSLVCAAGDLWSAPPPVPTILVRPATGPYDLGPPRHRSLRSWYAPPPVPTILVRPATGPYDRGTPRHRSLRSWSAPPPVPTILVRPATGPYDLGPPRHRSLRSWSAPPPVPTILVRPATGPYDHGTQTSADGSRQHVCSVHLAKTAQSLFERERDLNGRLSELLMDGWLWGMDAVAVVILHRAYRMRVGERFCAVISFGSRHGWYAVRS